MPRSPPDSDLVKLQAGEQFLQRARVKGGERGSTRF